MNLIQMMWQDVIEDCPKELLVASWAYLGLVLIIEMTLPVLFGYLTEAQGGMTYGFELAAMGLWWADKVGILLFAFCAVSSAEKIMFKWYEDKNRRIIS